MSILIKTMTNLPEHCYECPCHDGESGYCQADKDHRYSDYRPFWCPLEETRENGPKESEVNMTYADIYEEFCKKFPDIEVEDYRPASPLHIPQLERGIPNAIIVWLKNGSKVIYISDR